MSASVFPVPLSGIQETLIAAKGDLIVGLGNDNPGILTAGTTNQVLTVDSSTTSGLKWATPAGASFKGCSIHGGGDFGVSSATQTVVSWDAERYDTDAFHSTSTNNSRITIPTGLGGYYLVQGKVSWNTTNTAGDRRGVTLYKNGTGLANVAYAPTEYTGGVFTYVGNFTAGDYLQIYVYQNSGSTINANNTEDNSWFSVTYLGV